MNQAESNKDHGDKGESRGLKPEQGDRAEKKASSEASKGMEAHNKTVVAQVQEKRTSRKSGATASGFQSADSLLPAEKSKNHNTESANLGDSHTPHKQDGRSDSHKQDRKSDSTGHKPEATGKQAAESAINNASRDHHPGNQNAEQKKDHPADLAANALKSVFNLGQSIGKEADHLLKQAGQAEKQFEKGAGQFANGIKDGATSLVKQGEQGLHQVADGAGNTMKAIDKTAHQIQHNVSEGIKTASHQVGEHTNNLLKSAKHVQHRFQEGTEHAVKEVGKEIGKIEHDVTKGVTEFGKAANDFLKTNTDAGSDFIKKADATIKNEIGTVERQAVLAAISTGLSANEAVHTVVTKAHNAGDIALTLGESVKEGGKEALDHLGHMTMNCLTTIQEHPVETVVTVVGVGSAIALAGVIEVGSGGTATPLLVAAGTAAVEFAAAHGTTIGAVALAGASYAALKETAEAGTEVGKNGELDTLWNQENYSPEQIKTAKSQLIKDTSKAAFEDTTVALSFATLGAGAMLNVAKTIVTATETAEATTVAVTETGSAACTAEGIATDTACADTAANITQAMSHEADAAAQTVHTGHKLGHLAESIKSSAEITEKSPEILRPAHKSDVEESEERESNTTTSSTSSMHHE